MLYIRFRREINYRWIYTPQPAVWLRTETETLIHVQACRLCYSFCMHLSLFSCRLTLEHGLWKYVYEHRLWK